MKHSTKHVQHMKHTDHSTIVQKVVHTVYSLVKIYKMLHKANQTYCNQPTRHDCTYCVPNCIIVDFQSMPMSAISDSNSIILAPSFYSTKQCSSRCRTFYLLAMVFKVLLHSSMSIMFVLTLVY